MNSIRSWQRLLPEPEILLLGNEEGTAEVCAELGIKHIPMVACNSYGTPVVNSVFSEAERAAKHHLLCYVNADIILLSDFMEATMRVSREYPLFLMVGRRWNLDVEELIDFEPDWERKIRRRLAENGKLYPHFGIDYFVFPRGLWQDIPPFAVGRPGWDNWIIFRAKNMAIPVIDSTGAATAVHQNHDYSHHPGGRTGAMRGPESERNLEMAGEAACVYSILDADYVLTESGIKRKNLRWLQPFYLYRCFVVFADRNRMLKPLVRIIKKAAKMFGFQK